MKRLGIILFSMLLLASAPSVANGQTDDGMGTEMDAVSLTIQNNRAHITNADGKNLEIYNLTGVRVASIHIDSNDKHITLSLNRGCYIMKVGKVVRKVTIL